MKTLILLHLAVLLISFDVMSQRFGSELDKILLMNVNAISLAKMDNQRQAYVEQINNVNRARGDFRLRTHTTHLHQLGLPNIGWIEQRITAHELLLQKIGDINFINFIQRGDFSQFIIGQSGTGNVIDAYVFNNRGRSAAGRIVQEGNYNQVELMLLGAKEIDIVQRGDYHILNAIISGGEGSLRIYQQGGVVGNGMSVNVFNGN
jgi:hypothetical protein